MQTTTFFSYKGGVGRSLALANMACHLAKQGHTVFVLDFDLEAPGLHHKWEDNLKDSIQGGVLNLLHDFFVLDKEMGSVADFVVKIPVYTDETKHPSGYIHLLPAGLAPDRNYWRLLAELNKINIFHIQEPPGSRFFLNLKKQIEEQYKPDFLLIDARTGISDLSSLAISQLTDQVVCLFVLNPENLKGTAIVFDGIRRASDLLKRSIKIVPVLTRIPTDLHQPSETDLKKKVILDLNEERGESAIPLTVEDLFILHSDPELALSESLYLCQQKESKSALLKDYIKLSNHLFTKEEKQQSTAGYKPITWLHLSDLHIGSPGRSLWWQVQDEFDRSIQAWVETNGSPQLIVLTGDLTYSGQVSEFVELDLFLKALLAKLQKFQPNSMTPLIIPVPGNHDLQRPEGIEIFQYLILDRYRTDDTNEHLKLFKKTVWQEQNSQPLQPLFKNYQSWLEKSILPPLKNHPNVTLRTSFFPGDLFLEICLNDHLPLFIVALNTAWMHYTAGDFHGRVELASEQLYALLVPKDRVGEGLPLSRLAEQPALLLMHHPVSWFSAVGRETFLETIYTPDRFTLCLHGHQHRGRSEQISVSGGKPRYYFQVSSLFGMEHYGQSNEQRAIGYAWGRLSSKTQVHIWPFKRTERGGEQRFIWDSGFDGDKKTGHLLCKPLDANKPDTAPSVDMKPWLIHLLDQTEYLKIGGIGSGVGRVKTASRYPIQHLFTPLRSRGETLPALHSSEAEAFLWETRDDRVDLASLLPSQERLLIEGQPGAGKTTFLHWVSALLSKDCLGIEPPEGTSWRSHYLGMDNAKPARIPLLLSLANVAITLPKRDVSEDRCSVLLEILSTFMEQKDRPAWQNECHRLLQEGKAVLLLDGLDEVADPEIRKRLWTIFDDALNQWSKSQIIVTSRPFEVVALRERRFYHTTVEPFGSRETLLFIERWVNTLYNLQPGDSPSGEGERYRDMLQKAILDQPAIRQLATNPVMLTCLCVVHWNEGQLPDGRARVYQAVLRWLLSARTQQRKNQGYSDRFALEAFAALAIRMMGEKAGEKRALIPLEEAAQAVTEEIQRQFPKLTRKRDHLKQARDWLRFECLGSGIIEERHGGMIRFWHLTFQEYLAAQDLAWRGDCLDSIENCWWPVIENRLDDIQWRETVDLFPGVLFDEGGKSRIDFLLKQVLEKPRDPEEAPLATDAWITGIMGRILSPLQEVYDYNPPPEIEKQFRSVQKNAMAIFTRQGAALVPEEQRKAAAIALGQGGDPRLLTEHWIDLPGHDGVSLAKYLVTVQEFQLFIDYGGYQEPDYWDKEGWERRQKEAWQEPDKWPRQRQTPNCPVVGISWHEVNAYCKWLSQQRATTIRLSTQQEWRTAATPTEGKYPWGVEEPDSERYRLSVLGIICPVGIYPKGDGPYGHCDLGIFQFAEADKNNLDEKWVVGGWQESGEILVFNAWKLEDPYLRNAVIGFRLARSKRP